MAEMGMERVNWRMKKWMPGIRRAIYALCFCTFVAIDWNRSTQAEYIWAGAISTVGIVLWFLLLPQFSWKKEPWWLYAGWIFFSFMAISIRYQFPIHNYNHAYWAEALNVPLLGVVSIRLVREWRRRKVEWSRGRTAVGVVWAVMSLLMAVSAYGEGWPFWYLWMFGLLYLLPMEEGEKRNFADGMTDGVLAGFFVFQMFAFFWRPYDSVRYIGAYQNCNSNALMYLITYAFLLYRLHALLGKWLLCGKAGKRRWKTGLAIAFYGLLAGVVLALMVFTMTRMALLVAGLLTVIDGVISLAVVYRRPFWTVLGHCFVLACLALLLIRPVYLGVHYLPAVLNKPVIYVWEDKDFKIQEGDPLDSPKYISFETFREEAAARLGLKGVLGRLVSWDRMIVYAAGVGENYVLEGEDVYDSMKIRQAIYKLYLENLNLTGHSQGEGMFQITPDYMCYHAQNLFLQIAFFYGLPAGVLLLVLMVLTGAGSVRRAVRRRGPEDVLPLFVWLIFVGYGMTESVWFSGQTILILMYAVQKLLIPETLTDELPDAGEGIRVTGPERKRQFRKEILRAAGVVMGILAVTALLGLLISFWRDYRERKLIEGRGEVTIVVFGDSIWDICRDETGIAALLEERLKSARVVNCAIMGTSAAYRASLEGETPEETASWNQKSLMGILDSEDPLSVISEYTEVTEIPLEQADYIVLAYGLNDYFCAVPRKSEDAFDPYTYEGALRCAAQRLGKAFPQARIMILSQTYCQGYSYGKVDSESDYKDYGGGTGPDYVAAAEEAASEQGCIFVNNYEDLGIDLLNGPRYLSDATHLTALGRKEYAMNLAEYFLEDYRRVSRRKSVEK